MESGATIGGRSYPVQGCPQLLHDVLSLGLGALGSATGNVQSVAGPHATAECGDGRREVRVVLAELFPFSPPNSGLDNPRRPQQSQVPDREAQLTTQNFDVVFAQAGRRSGRCHGVFSVDKESRTRVFQ